MSEITFHMMRAPEYEDNTHPLVYQINALRSNAIVGELRYAPSESESFLLGVAVRYEHLRRGVASTLLDEWQRRSGKRELLTNAARENTPEGEALIQSFERRSGVAVRRVDTGLDGN